MKKFLVPSLALTLLALLGYKGFQAFSSVELPTQSIAIYEDTVNKQKFRNGDLIFQASQSRQSKAIQLATKSKYSHMGILYKRDGEFYVFEAVQPVRFTPLKSWIKRGNKGHYVVKRLKLADQVLTEETLAAMKEVGEKFQGKNYDIYFEWSDDRIYCSELVWKIYDQGADVQIGELQKLSEFDLSSQEVQLIMKERYQGNIPLNEPVISPDAMFKSELLETVFKN